MLTVKQVEKAASRDVAYKMSDSGGLYLLVSVGGGKYWRHNYTDKHTGKQKTKSYGVWPKVSLADARRAHAEFKDGQNIAETRSFAKLFEEMDKHRNTNISAGHRKKMYSIISNHLPLDLQNKPIGTFTRRDWVEIVQDCANKGVTYTAHQLAQIIGRVNDYAVDVGEVEIHKAADLTRALPNQKPVEHRAALTDESEHAEFFGKMYNTSSDERTRLGLLLLALTLTRTSELRFAKWSEFDFDKRIWTIADERMKARRTHLVPLTDEIMAALETLRQINGQSEYILASTRNPHRPISENAMIYAIYRMGYHGRMTGHGFRSMGSTWLNERKYHSPAIEMQLAHKQPDATKGAYDHAKHWDERVKIMNAWSKYVIGLFK